MSKKQLAAHIAFLAVTAFTAIAYIFLGEWIAYVRPLAIAELCVVALATVLFAFQSTRAKTLIYTYIAAGVLLLPRLVLSIMLVFWTVYAWVMTPIHLALLAYCIVTLAGIAKRRRAK